MKSTKERMMLKYNSFFLFLLFLISLSYQSEVTLSTTQVLGIETVNNDLYVIFPNKIETYDIEPLTLKGTKSLNMTIKTVNDYYIAENGNDKYLYNIKQDLFEKLPANINPATLIIGDDYYWCNTALYKSNGQQITQQYNLRTTCKNIIVSDFVYVVNENLIKLNKATFEEQWTFNPYVTGKCIEYEKKIFCEAIGDGSLSYIDNYGNIQQENNNSIYLDSKIIDMKIVNNQLLILTQSKLYSYNHYTKTGFVKKWEQEVISSHHDFGSYRFTFANININSVGTVDYSTGEIKSLKSITYTQTSKPIPIEVKQLWNSNAGKSYVIALTQTLGIGSPQYGIEAWKEQPTCAIETTGVSNTMDIVKGKVYPQTNVKIVINNKEYATQAMGNQWWSEIDFSNMGGDVRVSCIYDNQRTDSKIKVSEINRKMYVTYPSTIQEDIVIEVKNEYGVKINNIEVLVNKKDEYQGNGSVEIKLTQTDNTIRVKANGYETVTINLAKNNLEKVMLNIAVIAVLTLTLLIIRYKIIKRKGKKVK